MTKINVSRTCAEATQRERLTSGMQGAEVSFFFSADWDNLVKTAVFEGSGQSEDVLLTGASGEAQSLRTRTCARLKAALRLGHCSVGGQR